MSHEIPPFAGNINFNAQHSPMGAFASFTCGHFGSGGGIGVEIGKPASQSIYIGVKDGDRASSSPLRCLPFFRRATGGAGAADFLVEQAGPSEQNVKTNAIALDQEKLDRHYGWATDCWSSDDLDFSIYTPFAGIPDPAAASFDSMRDALVPAVIAELVVDNTAGKETKTAIFAIGFDTPGVRLLDSGLPDAIGFSLHDRIGFAAQMIEGDGLFPIQRWDVAEALRDPNPVHQLGNCAGFAFEIPAGELRRLRIAIGCYLPGVVTTRLEGKYLYTRYFSSLADVLSFALSDEHFLERRSVARALDRQLLASKLSPDQQFMIAHATRSYYGSTQLLEIGGEPFWIVNEGEYCMMNTLDLSIDHVFWELKHNRWVIKNLLDNFLRHYSYIDEINLDSRDATRRAPGGLSFSHDMGAHNNFSPQGQSSYELGHLKGCFSFMTQEQLCNWILLAACYVAETSDTAWLAHNAPLIDACIASMSARAHPRSGIMAYDSARCAAGQEITTYDSLDESLGQARANTYIAVKSWASWLGLGMLQRLRGASAQECDGMVQKLVESLAAAAGPDGSLPAVLEKDNPGFRSRILPAIEALIYPAYWIEKLSDGNGATEILRRALASPLIETLRKHTLTLLRDPARRNLFADGGIKLSSTSDNSWMSKIAIFQHVARTILHLDNDADIAEMFRVADAAHVAWQTDGSSYWACSDQFVLGIAKGSRYYPRIITAALWLEESAGPASPDESQPDATVHKRSVQT